MQKRIWKQGKRGTALALTFALTVSGIAFSENNAEAASKVPSLSKEKISLKAGESKKVEVVKKKSVTVKKVTWKIDSGKKVVKIAKSTKTYATIKALKKGSATVSAAIKVGKKTYKKKVKITVTAAKKPVVTKKPDVTKTPATEVPATDVPAPTKEPVTPATDAPAPTKEPVTPATDAPTAAPGTPAPTAAPGTPTPYPYITMAPDPTEVPDYLAGIKAVKSSWNDGSLANLSSTLAGCKVRITFKVKVVGTPANSGNVYVKSNYNSYPTIATISNISSEWQNVSVDYTFNTFTGNNPVLYFDDEKAADAADAVITEGVDIYYKDYQIEVLEQPDPLGGTALSKDNWNKGVLGSFVKATHENKKVRISFKLREKGVDSPTGTCTVQSNYPGSTYPELKTGVAITKEWTTVSFECEVGTIGNQYPSIYLNGDAITDEMTMYMDEFKIEVLGALEVPDATPTPTPAPAHSVYLQGDAGYDATKGGVYKELTGIGAWSSAYSKFGADYGLTDTSFSSVTVELAFYKNGVEITSLPEDMASHVSITVASSNDYGNDKEAQTYNAGIGATTIKSDSEGTKLKANTIVIQIKKAASDLTAYDAILVKSITLTE